MSDAPPLCGISIPLRGIGSSSDPPFLSPEKCFSTVSENRLGKRENRIPGRQRRFPGKYPRQEMVQNSRETDLSAILGRSHPGCTPSYSLLQYREIRDHKSEELFQVTKNPAGEKIAEEPAESLARHQNCQFRENVRGTKFKGSQLFKLLQAQKKKSAKFNALRTFLFIWCRRGDSNSHAVASTRP